MSCYQSATAKIERGTTGLILVVIVEAYGGDFPDAVALKEVPSQIADVHTISLSLDNAVEAGETVTKTFTKNLNSSDEIITVEIFCNGKRPGKKIPIT